MINNSLVKHLIKLRQNRAYREEQGSVVVSGLKLVKEIAQRATPKRVFVEDPSLCANGSVYMVSHPLLKKITGLPSPEPIAAEFPLPPTTDLTHVAPLLILDAIRDPGNLGTLIRTALALGWGGVFFLPTCVDPFHEKVIRASRGALFYLPWREGSWEEFIALKNRGELTLFIADKEGAPLSSIRAEKKSALLMSNEAQGVRPRVVEFGQKITIPMMGSMESLNVAVAGGILMYYLND
jgi:RNA methyltransferase, TrmH family